MNRGLFMLKSWQHYTSSSLGMIRKPVQPDALEANLDALKKIVGQMEQKNLSLDHALAQFAQGIELVRHCQKMLENAEQQVSILLQKEGDDVLCTFEEPA